MGTRLTVKNRRCFDDRQSLRIEPDRGFAAFVRAGMACFRPVATAFPAVRQSGVKDTLDSLYGTSRYQISGRSPLAAQGQARPPNMAWACQSGGDSPMSSRY